MRTKRFVTIVLLWIMAGTASYAQESKEHYANIPENKKWKKIETYVFTSAHYVIATPAGRTCEVGTGVFLFGKPLGGKFKLSGQKDITVFGAGGIYVRVVDGKGDCKVGFALKNQTLIQFPEIEFP